MILLVALSTYTWVGDSTPVEASIISYVDCCSLHIIVINHAQSLYWVYRPPPRECLGARVGENISESEGMIYSHFPVGVHAEQLLGNTLTTWLSYVSIAVDLSMCDVCVFA